MVEQLPCKTLERRKIGMVRREEDLLCPERLRDEISDLEPACGIATALPVKPEFEKAIEISTLEKSRER